MTEPVRISLDTELVDDGRRVRFEGRLLAFIRRAEAAEVYVSHVPLLEIYSQGRTEHEAIRAIESAIRLYVAAGYRRGSLAPILQRHSSSSSPEYIRVRDADGLPPTAEVPVTAAVGALQGA